MRNSRRLGGRLTRRSFLKASASTVALLTAASAQFPFGTHVAEAAGPEVTKATLGFILTKMGFERQ